MPDAFVGVICKNTVDGANTNYSTATIFPTWSAENIDTDGSHSTSSNTELITIPSALNGRYGIFSTMCKLNSASGWWVLFIEKNGSPVAWAGHEEGALSGYLMCHTPPLLLTTGDSYRVLPWTSDTSTSLESDSSCFTLMVIG